MNLISKCILKRKKFAQGYFDTEELSDTENVYIVSKDGKYGLLDGTTRKLIMLLQDYEITSYSDNTVGVTKDGKAGYITIEGKQVVDFIFDKAEAFQYNHLARVSKDDMTGYLDRYTLQTLIPVKYDYISNFQDGYAMIMHRDKSAYVDDNGQIIGGLEFDQVGKIGEGLIPVLKGSKWGYINLEGKEVIPFKYSTAGTFTNGYAVVKQNGKTGVINKLGQKVIACRYDEVRYVEDEIACVVLNNRIGYVDTNDRTIVPCELLSYLGETDTEYQINLDYIKMVYSKKAAEIKSQAAKDRLIREFNLEMKKMADARVAYFAYLTKQKQKEYRTTQLREDCVTEIKTSKQGETEPDYEILNVMDENDADSPEADTTEATTPNSELNDEVVDEIVVPEFNPDEELADGTEVKEIVDTVPEDEIVNNN